MRRLPHSLVVYNSQGNLKFSQKVPVSAYWDVLSFSDRRMFIITDYFCLICYTRSEDSWVFLQIRDCSSTITCLATPNGMGKYLEPAYESFQSSSDYLPGLQGAVSHQKYLVRLIVVCSLFLVRSH